jgi:chromosome segregation ATPase
LENQLKALEGVHNTICNDNKNRRLRIQLRDEQLMEKENEVESLIERRNCNELVIEELRAEITKLQDEENELKGEL